MKTRPSRSPLIAMAALACAVLACLQLRAVSPTDTPMPAVTATEAVLGTETVAVPSTQASTETPTVTPTVEFTATVGTFSSLKGTVLQRSNCRYGPGANYLYKIGLLEGAPVEVIGRTIDGGWAYAQFAGTHNLCWVNSKLLQLDGDIMSLQDYYPEKAPLPMTSKYGPVAVTSVSASGASVTVDWTPIVLPDYAMVGGAGETEYVVEVWTCENGSPGFTAFGTDDTSMTFQVDDSCGQHSHADIVAQNKLGVSGITQITLP